jgi:nucleoside-diphosphate-sugar epimerase
MASSENLHVVFGAGPLGLSVARALLAHGARVRVVSRTGAAQVPPGAEARSGDAYDPDVTAALTEKASVVYQCAQPPYHQWPEKFPRLQGAILEGAARSGAKLVIAENLYMYGEVEGTLHEELPYAARTRKGLIRARMAEAALRAHAEGTVRVVLARGSDFFGPGVLQSAMGERAILPALKGKVAQLTGRIAIPHTFTFIDDFGAALALLGEHDEALGQAWHVPNDRPDITQEELMRLFFRVIGLPPRMGTVGTAMIAVAGLFMPGARETVEMMYEFNKPFVVDSGKFERAFGMRATPLEEAVEKTVAWYRSRTQR